jgi:hypothetical protein
MCFERRGHAGGDVAIVFAHPLLEKFGIVHTVERGLDLEAGSAVAEPLSNPGLSEPVTETKSKLLSMRIGASGITCTIWFAAGCGAWLQASNQGTSMNSYTRSSSRSIGRTYPSMRTRTPDSSPERRSS